MCDLRTGSRLLMPLYPLRCPDCGAELERYAPIAQGKSSTNCGCGGVLRRVWTPPALATPFQAHWNASVGQYVTSRAHFQSLLHQAGDRAEAETGVKTRYVAMDAAEAPQMPGGTEHREKALRDAGWTEGKATIVL